MEDGQAADNKTHVKRGQEHMDDCTDRGKSRLDHGFLHPVKSVQSVHTIFGFYLD